MSQPSSGPWLLPTALAVVALIVAGYAVSRVDTLAQRPEPASTEELAQLRGAVSELRDEVERLRLVRSVAAPGPASPARSDAPPSDAPPSDAPPLDAPVEMRAGTEADIDDALRRQAPSVKKCIELVPGSAARRDVAQVELQIDPFGSIHVGELRPLASLQPKQLECLRGVLASTAFPNMGQGPAVVRRPLVAAD